MLRKSLFNKFAAITVSLALATGFFSCGENAGLGSSIDTKAPTLAIEYPPSGAAIRDSFILAGSCSDDKAISRVLVTVKRLESDIEFEPLSYTATVSADAKSWQIKLNEKDEANESYYNGWQLPDGKYEMSVTAYDNVGNNSGASSRSFEIDNTPPLFIISNPGVVKNENKEPSAYGSVFTIDGTIADNHEIASMDVEIYNEAGELLSKENYNGEEINSFREEEIPTAGGTSVQIAQYVEGESNNRYSTLHPESSGTEYYYAKITLADATQVYQNPPKSKDRAADEYVEVLPEDLVGNKSSKFYLYDDVYTSLISKKNGKGLSAAALKDIVSGIISDKATLAYLANAEKDSSNEENYLCFSLNPEANPTYNISGFGYEYNNVYQSASCGNTVNITINSGLDNVAVNPGTVKVWLKEFDSIPEKEEMTKAIMELAGKVKNRESVSDGGAIFDGETADEDKKIDDWSLIYDYSNYSGSSVSTKTFAISLPSKGIVLNKYYVLAVTGYDVDEVAFKQDAVYAFAGNVSGIAPTIEIKSPDNGSFVKAGEFSFEGTAVVNNADLNVKSLEATIKATNGTQAIGNEEGYSVKVTYNSTENHWPENDALAVVWNEEESVWKWTFTPSKIKDFLSETKDATKYALSIKGVSSSDHDVTMSSMVQLDITPPVVSINTITPIVEGKDFDGSNNVYINGTVRIMGTIVEQNLKEVTYDIEAKTEEEDDFVSILEMMKKALKDSSYPSDLFDGNLEQSNSIDISFPTTYLTAYYAQKTGKADPKITIKVTLMAEDIVGNKGEYSSTIYNKTLDDYPDGRDFIIYQETDRPKITLDNAFTEYEDNGVTKSLLWKESDDLEHNNSCNINTDHNLFGTVSNNRLQVSASDDDALSAIRISVFAYKDDKDELVGGGSSFFSKTTGTYKCDLPDEEGVYKVKVEAFDSKILPTDLNDSSTSFGYNSTDEFYIAISSGAPNIEISKPYAGSYQSGTVDIAGSVTKKEWIKSVEGALNQNGELLESIVVSEPAFASQEATAWNSSVTLPTNASGNYSLVYTVTDRFGQKNSVERSFMVDIYPPKFKIEEPDSENRNVFTKDGIYTVKGSISDGEGTSGIKGLYYSLKAQTASGDTYKPFNGDKLSDDWQQASVIAKEKGQFTWTANIDLTGIASTDGSESNTVYFAAIDEAGNISLISENSDSSSLKITRDTVSPSTTLLGSGLKKPADKVSENEKTSLDLVGNLILKDDSELEESLTYYANGSYTLSGLVTEVSPADVTITAKMGTNDLTVTRDETNSKKWSVVGGTDEGTHAYEITITDKAGNSVSKKISVIKDSQKPNLTVSNETTDKDALVTNKLITEENTNHSIEDGIHKYLLSGKWSDKTSGTGKLQYRVRPHKEGDSYVDFYSDWQDISDVTTSTAESSWSFKVDMLEGYGLGTGVCMQGRAIDAAGNITYTEEYKGIRVDFGKPTVTKTSEAPEYVAKDGKLTITGTVSDSYKLSSSPVIVVAKIDGTKVANGEKGFSFTQNVAEDTKTGTYTITVDASDLNNGTWTFEVKANDWAARESAALSFSTTVDTVAPAWNEIKVNNELYDSDANRTWYKNATLPFSGSLTETGSKVKEIQWSVIKAGASEPAEGGTGTVSPKADNTFNTNIGEFIAKKDAGGSAVANTVKLVAVDYAGNKSVEKTFNIYIDSEAPTLVKSNKDGTQFSDKNHPFDIELETSDDASGVKSATITITLDGSSVPLKISGDETTIEAREDANSGKWKATIPKDFLSTLENKTYAVKAKISDKAKNSTDITLFRIDVDDEKPKIGKLSVTNTNSKYSVYKSTTETETYFVHNGDGNKFEILGAVQDAKSGVARVELWNGDTKLGSSTSLPIADIDLSALTDSATLTLKATDNAGNVQTQDIVVNFDNDAPTFAIISTTDREIYTKENIYTVRGTISDGEATSGIKGMYYTLKEQTATDGAYSVLAENGSIASGWLAASVVNNGEGAYGWTANIDLSSISSVDGTKANTVYFAVVDEIGNVSLVSENTDSSIKITRDTVAPASTLLGTGLKQAGSVVTEETDAAGNISLPANSELTDASTYYATGDSYSLNGLITEASGKYDIVIKKDGVILNGAPLAENNWSVTGEAVDGTYFYEIAITDKAGNSVTKKIAVTKDTQKPTWNDNAIKVNKAAYASGEDHTWYKNATLPFAGSLTETGSKVKEIQWTVIKAGASEPDADGKGTFAPKADGSFDTNIGEFVALRGENGAVANTVKLIAVDYAGNISEEKTFDIFIDSEAPKLEGSNREGTEFSNKKLDFPVELTVSDDASGVDSATLTVSEDGSTVPLEISSGKTTIEATEDANSGKWNAKIPADFLAKLGNNTYAVKAKIADKAGNKSDVTLFRIDVDAEDPTLGNLSITNTSSVYSVYKSTTETETYFVHNNDGNKFSIFGSAQDAKSGIKTVELFEGDTKLGEASSLPISDISFADQTGSKTLTLKATDNAGNEATKTIVVNFDNEAPKGIHAIDEKNKDLFFRVGKADSDETEITKTGENPLWNDTIDLDVGGKYANDSYSNSQTIRLRGTMHDAGSGVEMIYYKVINSTTEVPQEGDTGLIKAADNFLKNYKTDNNGYFKANRESKKRVTYTSSDGKVYDTNGNSVLLSGTDTIFNGFAESFGSITGKKYATITTNYDNSFTGFDDGYNYLILVAVDNVGNAALDTVKIVQGEDKVPYSNFSLNVDTETPTLESNLSATQLTNCAEDIIAAGTFDDNASGVKSVVLEIINDSITDKNSATVETITLKTGSDGWSDADKFWKATIPATNTEIFPANTTATFSVKATVTDAAGNSSSSNIFNIQIDKTNPEFKNTVLATTSATYKVYRPDEEADTYHVNPSNGTFSISGVATDDYGVAQVALSVPGLAMINPQGNASFNFTGLDISELTGTSVVATLTVTDKAGNTATKPVTINFDKSGPSWVAADFRVNDAIFDTTENAKNWYKDNLLSFAGSYTDGLSEIEKVTYTIVPAGAGTQSTGTFSTTKGTGDNAEKETFTTNLKGFVDKTGDSGEAYNLVKLTAYDKVGNPSDEKQFQIWIDTTSPTIVSDTKTTRLTNRQSDIKVTGSFDDNASGVKSIVLEVISDKTKAVVENGTITINSAATGLDASEKTWTATISKSILPTDASESCTVKATITDNAGNPASPTIFNIQIDTEAPAFKNTALVVDETDETVATDYKVYKPNENVETYYVNPTQGKFKITGVATDNYGVAKVELSIPGLETITPVENGSFDFTGLDLHTLTGTSVVATLTASDEAGNKSVAKDITINFDSTVPVLGDDFRINGGVYKTEEGAKNWYKDNLLTFSGSYTEAGSGIEKVTYEITKAGDAGNAEGSFATTKDASKETFSSNLSGFVEKEGSTGNEYNTIKLVAYDKVGNKSTEKECLIYLDTVAPTVTNKIETFYTNGEGNLKNVTGEDAVISGTVSDTAAGVGSVKISVNGKEINAGDNATTGYGTLTLTKTGTVGTGESAVTYNDNMWKWETKVAGKVFKNGNTVTDGNYQVSVVAEDNAVPGNPTNSTIANVIVDTTPPTVKLTAPTNADSEKDDGKIYINGTIELKGSIEDANILPTTAITGIRYNTTSKTLANDSTDWKNLAEVEEIELGLTGNYTFTVTGFDTTKLADETYYIQAVAVDIAGNPGYSEAVEVVISQDTDRPKVKINNLNEHGSSYILMYGTRAQVTGTVSDDDTKDNSVVKEFWMTEYPATATKKADGTYTVTEKISETASRAAVNKVLSTSWRNTTGEFTFEPPTVNDGPKHFYILVIDNEGGVFYTTAARTGEGTVASPYKYLSNPKISVKGTAVSESVNSTQFSYSSDGTNPAVKFMEGLPYASNVANAEVAKDDAGNDFVLSTEAVGETPAKSTENATLNTSFKVGGVIRRYVKFYFVANDASGIAGITAELKDVSGNTLKKLSTAATIGTHMFETTDNWVIGGTFNATGSASENAKWTTDFVDLGATEFYGKAEQITVSVTPYDKAGLAGNGTCNFYVDNVAPSIEGLDPDTDTLITGDVTLSGTLVDSIAGPSSVEWGIPKIGATEPENWYSNLHEGSTVSRWKFLCDGTNGNNPKLDDYDTSEYASTIADGVYTLPIYIKAADKLGNSVIKTDYKIKHDPNGDRPTLKFTYPKTENYDPGENFVTLGGVIRVSGSAKIPKDDSETPATPEKNFFQLVQDGTKFDVESSTDTTNGPAYVKTLTWKNDQNQDVRVYPDSAIKTVKDVIGETNYNAVKLAETAVSSAQEGSDARKTAEVNLATELRKYGFSSISDFDSWWGIEADGTSSWNFSLNENDELNNAGEGTNNIKIRVCGLNSKGKLGPWTTDVISIHIDKDAPQISGIVAQYSALPTSVVDSDPASQTYEPDMYLRGQWYVKVTVKDDGGLRESETLPTLTITNVESKDYKWIVDDDKKGGTAYIKLSSASGKHTYTVKVFDKDNKSSSKDFSFNIDNTAPSFENLQNAKGDELVEQTAPDTFENDISNTNYVYTIKGSSKDEGAGVEHIVFYYVRKVGVTKASLSGGEVVIDPMIKARTDDDGKLLFTDAKVAISGLEALTLTQPKESGSGNDEYNLYAKKISGTATAKTFAGTFDNHVRVGGLITFDKIIYRKITAKADGAVTFEPELTTVPTGNVDAWFPVAQVIDSTKAAINNSLNPFTFDVDAADGMPESFTESGKKWDWSATIHSENLPDGPVSLVILAFDKAGNVSGKTFNAMVANNAPRLAKVHLGTDLNKSGTYTDNEFETYNILASTGNEDGEKLFNLTTKNFKTYSLNAKDEWVGKDSSRSSFKIKNKLAVIPEFVGGNGEINLVFNNNAPEDALTDTGNKDSEGNKIYTVNDRHKTKDDGTLLPISGVIGTGDIKGKGVELGATDTPSLGDDTDKNTDGTEKTRAMTFTFWDSTDESESGTDSQYAFLRVTDFIVAQIDSTPPNVVVSEFAWNQAGGGSYIDTETREEVYKNNIYYAFTENTDPATGKVTRTYDDSTALGHIELKKDWTAVDSANNKLTGWDGKGVKGGTQYDSDPKVSGKIIVRGTAYDDTFLRKLSFTMTNFNGGASCDIAEYSGGDWSLDDAQMTGDGNKGYEVLSVKDVYFGQDGHKVSWEVAIDTECLSDKAHIDAEFNVVALDDKDTDDTKKNSSADSTATVSGTTDATKHVPVYVMDVVPYITKLYTNITKNAKDFDRSATGRYIVRSGETNVRIYGFNLEANATTGNVTIGSTSGIKTIAVLETNGANYLTFPVGTNTSSGKLSISVNSISSLNNINRNPTIQTGATGADEDSPAMYNSQANNKTSNRLTDDVELWIWDMGNFLDERDITSPMLKMDKYGNYYMSYGYKVPSMYVQKNTSQRQVDFSYNKFHNTNVLFDDNGNTYAVATNTDRTYNDASRFVFYTPSGTENMPDSVDSWEDNSYAYKSESKRHLEMAYNKDTKIYNINRVKRPKLASYTDGTTTYLGMVYFDYNNDDSPVKFRFGSKAGGGYTYTKGNTSYTFTWNSSRKGFTTTDTNISTSYYVRINGNYYKVNRSGQGTNRIYTFTGYSGGSFDSYLYTRSNDATNATLDGGIMANVSANGHKTDDVTYDCSASGYHTIADKNTTKTGGEYVAVGLVPAKINNQDKIVAVVAWYDAQNKKLCYSFNTDPNTVSANNNVAWQTTNSRYLDTEEYTGWYVDLAVDARGGIHIAYYNSAKGNLKYVYLSSYNAEPTSPVTVDSYLSVGTNITVNTRYENGNYVPYIYYYNAANSQTPNSIKVAWRKDFTALRNGADPDTDLFTGAWECMTIPSVNIPVDATVCGGVPSESTTTADNQTVFLGYMSDAYYEKAVIKGNITE